MVKSKYKIHFGAYTTSDAIDDRQYHSRYICNECSTEIHFLYKADLLDEISQRSMDIIEGVLYRKMYLDCSCDK